MGFRTRQRNTVPQVLRARFSPMGCPSPRYHPGRYSPSPSLFNLHREHYGVQRFHRTFHRRHQPFLLPSSFLVPGLWPSPCHRGKRSIQLRKIWTLHQFHSGRVDFIFDGVPHVSKLPTRHTGTSEIVM